MQVVDAFDGSVGCSSAAVVGQDFFSPCDDGVHDLLVFGDLACRVEVGEPSQSCVGSVEVFGLVQLVELLERVPSGAEPGVSLEEAVEMLLVPFCEMIRPPQESEAGSEQVRLERWGPLLGIAALQFPPHEGQAFGEPPCHVKAVQDVAGVGQVLGDGRLI